ncbi:response regulator [Desulfopila sp. IMCC35008]|uniref:response regulator n=1 Tax=Desulfopila sp. IMCC35008 TaxID=2653858 RepID=UPI0013CF822F|nr:response regulator [Desulfopila sp. IMCC35008]
MKQVLIVDDETRLLQSIEAGLKNYQEEFSVHTAGNGKEAIKILKKDGVDLVVTDLRMPEMDGFELLAYLSSRFPFMPSIVMTAFATPEIEEKLNVAGTLKLLEKPIDIEKLAEAIRGGLRQDGDEGSLAGFSLANFLQLLSMEQKTCLLNITGENLKGHIYLNKGEIYAAVADGLKGEEALYHLLAADNVTITFQKLPKRRIPRMIDTPLMSLLIEGMRLQDERLGAKEESELESSERDIHNRGDEDQVAHIVSAEPSQTDSGEHLAEVQEILQGDLNMGKIEDSLAKLSDVEGFMAAGVFTPNGEMAGQVNNSNMKLAEIGSLANDVLLKAQKATDIMNVGRGQQVHVEAPSAHVIARCLNENESFSESAAGKAHVHLVMLLQKDGNLAMGKMKLDSVIQEVAESFR